MSSYFLSENLSITKHRLVRTTLIYSVKHRRSITNPATKMIINRIMGDFILTGFNNSPGYYYKYINGLQYFYQNSDIVSDCLIFSIVIL